MRYLHYILLIGTIQFSSQILLGQAFCDYRYNNIWLLGGRDNDTIVNNYGGCEIDFSTSPITLRYHPKPINAPFQNASICSRSGNLLCYSNGCEVRNGQDQIVINGDSLNPGEIFTSNCPDIGYNGFQNMFILPFSSDTNLYYIFHIDKVYNYDPNAPFVVHTENLYYSKLDVTAHGGKGELIEKNRVIVRDTGMLGSPMSAVRHGNGTDWWIITPDRWTNGFYITLLDSTGPEFVGVQYIGDLTDPRATGGQGKFSPDGSKFAWYHPLNGLFLYDFDRALGSLNNFIRIDIPEVDFITGGCEFSPSGRFLYINQDTSLFQLDMKSENIQESLIKIADYDGFKEPLPTTFFLRERTPDQRIIVNALNGSQYLHVIQEPDRKGLGCRFEQHTLKLPTVNNFTLPHFPNYSLGQLSEPLCDSIWVSTDQREVGVKGNQYKVAPNPAIDYLRIVSFENEYIKNIEVSLYNTHGSLVLSSKQTLLDLSDLTSGIYICRITDDTGYSQIEKIVVSH